MNHVTHHLNNLSTGTSYIGEEQIWVGNGADLNIFLAIRYFFLLLPPILLPSYSKYKIYFMSPFISKNLLNVSQFASDNGVFFKFHLTFRFVKDLTTGKTLLQEQVHEGLYKFCLTQAQANTSSSALMKNQSSNSSSCNYYVELWHSRLGHRACAIVTQIL